MEKKINFVLDANVFIEGSGLTALINNYTLFTTNGVINELQNKSHYDNYSKYSTFIIIKSPNSESINIIKDFAGKTGDYISLSKQDIELIALGYELIKNEGLESNLLLSPLEKIENMDYKPTETEKQNTMWNENKDFNENSDDGWITPDNYNTFNNTTASDSDYLLKIGTGIITSDYAMQVT